MATGLMAIHGRAARGPFPVVMEPRGARTRPEGVGRRRPPLATPNTVVRRASQVPPIPTPPAPDLPEAIAKAALVALLPGIAGDGRPEVVVPRRPRPPIAA